MDDVEEEVKFKCDVCEDTGTVFRTEWVGNDESYEVEERCDCLLEG